MTKSTIDYFKSSESETTHGLKDDMLMIDWGNNLNGLAINVQSSVSPELSIGFIFTGGDNPENCGYIYIGQFNRRNIIKSYLSYGDLLTLRSALRIAEGVMNDKESDFDLEEFLEEEQYTTGDRLHRLSISFDEENHSESIDIDLDYEDNISIICAPNEYVYLCMSDGLGSERFSHKMNLHDVSRINNNLRIVKEAVKDTTT